MPPADAAPDPLDRPARALHEAFRAATRERPGDPFGLWLSAGLWANLEAPQRDLARRLAAAVLAADGRPGPVTNAGGRP
jgi:hypothetical protein